MYQIALISLLSLGFVLSSVFLAQFRPQQWKRLASWDAVGWILIVWLWYARSLGVIALRWPKMTVPGFWDGFLSIGALILINALLIIRVISFQSFRTRDREEQEAAQLAASESAARNLPG